MAAFNPAANRSLQGGKGGSPGFRFAIYAVISIILMFMDLRQRYLEQARFLLQGFAFPLQLAVSSPTKAVTYVQDNMKARDVLEDENKKLRQRLTELELQVVRFEALAKENGELRGLKQALPSVVEKWLVGEIVLMPNTLRQRILINRGTNNGLFKGQTVIDDAGVIGQTTHVGPWSAEVILITDPEHAIPVQIERTGRRTIAEGAGDKTSLVLPFLPANEDIRPGDRLVTSGLDDVFPAGYPVAKVTEVHREGADPHAQIRAVPYARIDTDREVVLVWFRHGHPASPADLKDRDPETGDLKSGNPAMQPQEAHPGASASVSEASASSASVSSSSSSASASASASVSSASASAAVAGASSSASKSSTAVHSSSAHASSVHTSASAHAASSAHSSQKSVKHP